MRPNVGLNLVPGVVYKILCFCFEPGFRTDPEVCFLDRNLKGAKIFPGDSLPVRSFRVQNHAHGSPVIRYFQTEISWSFGRCFHRSRLGLKKGRVLETVAYQVGKNKKMASRNAVILSCINLLSNCAKAPAI